MYLECILALAAKNGELRGKSLLEAPKIRCMCGDISKYLREYGMQYRYILFGKWHQNHFVSRTQVLHQTCNVLILHQEVMYSNTIHLRHELMDGPDLPLRLIFDIRYDTHG